MAGLELDKWKTGQAFALEQDKINAMNQEWQSKLQTQWDIAKLGALTDWQQIQAGQEQSQAALGVQSDWYDTQEDMAEQQMWFDLGSYFLDGWL